MRAPTARAARSAPASVRTRTVREVVAERGPPSACASRPPAGEPADPSTRATIGGRRQHACRAAQRAGGSSCRRRGRRCPAGTGRRRSAGSAVARTSPPPPMSCRRRGCRCRAGTGRRRSVESAVARTSPPPPMAAPAPGPRARPWPSQRDRLSESAQVGDGQDAGVVGEDGVELLIGLACGRGRRRPGRPSGSARPRP